MEDQIKENTTIVAKIFSIVFFSRFFIFFPYIYWFHFFFFVSSLISIQFLLKVSLECFKLLYSLLSSILRSGIFFCSWLSLSLLPLFILVLDLMWCRCLCAFTKYKYLTKNIQQTIPRWKTIKRWKEWLRKHSIL